MITEFFMNKEIFITGGSGIVGTALIEQILRSCNVRKIYLLLRPRKNMSLEQRLADVKEKPVFRQLKLQKPHELDEKLAIISGDVMLPLLGITVQSAKRLENVSIVYHCAATVRFDASLREALKLNVGGTLEALKFAQTLKKLKAFMHVSTFFSNPYLIKVEPKFYEAPMDWKFCLDLVERKDVADEELDTITRKLIVGFPNTYTFTKNLAESLVNDHKDKLPVCIYRPSIVFCALDDPEPGFSPTLVGFMGLYAISGAGLLKTIYVDKNTRLDISPQDIAVKNMLYYTLKTSQLYETTKPPDIPVYITSTGPYCNLTLTNYIDIMEDFGLWEQAAYEKNLFLPGLYCTSNRFVYTILVLILQLLPAIILDSILKMTGRKPFLMSIQRKVYQTLEVLKPFMFNTYESDGITDFNEIYEQYKGTNFSVEILLQVTDLFYNVTCCRRMLFNVRKVLIAEDPKTLPKARQIFRIKVWLYKFWKFYILYRVYQKVIEYVTNWYAQWGETDACLME